MNGLFPSLMDGFIYMFVSLFINVKMLLLVDGSICRTFNLALSIVHLKLAQVRHQMLRLDLVINLKLLA